MEHSSNSRPGEVTLTRKAAPEANALTYPCSLSLPSDITLERWKQVGEKIARLNASSAWWLGDWLVFGQDRYPDRYQRAIAETTLDYQTLRNYAWVCRKFEVARRRSKLSLQHHAELAALPKPEQDMWLSRAEHHGWSRNELRRRVKADRTPTGPGVDASAETIQLRLPQTRQQAWERAARNADCELTQWIVETLDRAAAAAEHAMPV